MATLIFDIETVGEEWSKLDAITKESLLWWIHKTARNEKEKRALEEDVISGLGFSPLTGFIVALGIYDLERGKGVVYYQAEERCDFTQGNYTFKSRTEVEMLSEFWEGAEHYNTFVSFNGRCFDVPFLLHRSIACDVVPSKNLLEGRYPYQQKCCRHVDLQDELTFFGAMSKKPSLHLFCRAFGVASSKEEMGGDDVAELFRQKKFRDIAVYNSKDLEATSALYKKWQTYLSYQDKEVEINF